VANQLQEEEREADAFQHAREVLREKFQSPAHDGPVKYQRFQGTTSPEEANQAYAAVQEFLSALA
jgi:cold shock CspA family protein